MQESVSWLDQISATINETLNAAAAYLPSFAAAIAILLIGWILARLVRGALRHVSNWTNRALDRVFRHGALASARVSARANTVVGEFAFWTVLFMAATIAANVAGLTVLSDWLGAVVAHLPNVAAGLVIIVVGYFLSVLGGEEVAAAARSAKAAHSALVGRLAQGAIFIAALIVGLDQIGIDVTFLVALFGITLGAALFGLSLAFGLGARDFVSNVIGARNARAELERGLTVRIGDIEGEVLEVTATQIAVDTPEGRRLVPARQFDREGLAIVDASAARDEADG